MPPSAFPLECLVELLRRIWHIARAEWTLGTPSSQESTSAGSPHGALPDDLETPGERSAGVREDPVLSRYYANLEVPYGSDLATVRRAWKELLKKYHPDRHGADPEKCALANELTSELNKAYYAIEHALGNGDAAGTRGRTS